MSVARGGESGSGRSGRPYTGVWMYFEKLDNKKAECNICKQLYSYASTTSNLKKHLRLKHTSVYVLMIKSLLQGNRNTEVPSGSSAFKSSLVLSRRNKKRAPARALLCNCTAPVAKTINQTKERSEEFSNELVRAVEKHPELYRGGHTSLERLKHWKEIANELGESVSYCKEEWRCLKKLFQSHVKQANGPDDTNEDMDQQMELMAFLMPYVNQESDESEGEEDGGGEGEEDGAGEGEEDGYGEVEELATQDDEQFEDPLDNKSVVFENVKISKPRRLIIPRKRKMESIPDDSSKKLFLLSLMPDVRLMDNTQMRRFKRKVLELIDDILNDD